MLTLTERLRLRPDDVLTMHRQLSHVEPPGHIATMGFEPNNFKHTYIYRRATAEPSK
ncbi:MAG: hypothetical protein ACRD3G_31025 [Vicinamibacterales bacterium]